MGGTLPGQKKSQRKYNIVLMQAFMSELPECKEVACQTTHKLCTPLWVHSCLLGRPVDISGVK